MTIREKHTFVVASVSEVVSLIAQNKPISDLLSRISSTHGPSDDHMLVVYTASPTDSQRLPSYIFANESLLRSAIAQILTLNPEMFPVSETVPFYPLSMLSLDGVARSPVRSSSVLRLAIAEGLVRSRATKRAGRIAALRASLQSFSYAWARSVSGDSATFSSLWSRWSSLRRFEDGMSDHFSRSSNVFTERVLLPLRWASGLATPLEPSALDILEVASFPDSHEYAAEKSLRTLGLEGSSDVQQRKGPKEQRFAVVRRALQLARPSNPASVVSAAFLLAHLSRGSLEYLDLTLGLDPSVAPEVTGWYTVLSAYLSDSTTIMEQKLLTQLERPQASCDITLDELLLVAERKLSRFGELLEAGVLSVGLGPMASSSISVAGSRRRPLESSRAQLALGALARDTDHIEERPLPQDLAHIEARIADLDTRLQLLERKARTTRTRR